MYTAIIILLKKKGFCERSSIPPPFLEQATSNSIKILPTRFRLRATPSDLPSSPWDVMSLTMTSPFYQYACWSIERDSLRVKYQATRSSDFPPLMLLKYSIASALGFCSFLIPKLSCAFTKNTENWVRLPIHAIRSKRLLATDLADKGKEGEQRLAKFLIPRFKNNFLKNIDYGIS